MPFPEPGGPINIKRLLKYGRQISKMVEFTPGFLQQDIYASKIISHIVLCLEEQAQTDQVEVDGWFLFMHMFCFRLFEGGGFAVFNKPRSIIGGKYVRSWLRSFPECFTYIFSLDVCHVCVEDVRLRWRECI